MTGNSKFIYTFTNNGLSVKPFYFLLFTALFYLPCAPARAAIYPKNRLLHEWYNNYYLHKDNDPVTAALDYFFSGNFPATTMRKGSLQGFFSTLFKQYPNKAVVWIKRCHLNTTERKPVIYALAQAGLHAEARSLAVSENWRETEITAMFGALEPGIQTPDRLTSKDIGWLWGAFKASGNPRHLDKLLDMLVLSITQRGNSIDESFQIILVQSLKHHIDNHVMVLNHYSTRYRALDSNLQEELDLLFSSLEEEGEELNCE